MSEGDFTDDEEFSMTVVEIVFFFFDLRDVKPLELLEDDVLKEK